MRSGERAGWGGIAIVTCCCAVAVYASISAINLAGARTDSARVTERVRAAFENGQLTDEALARGNWRRGINQFNDCLLLQGVLLSRTGTLADAVATRTVADPGACPALRRLVNDPASSTAPLHAYDRYVFGARGASALSLSVASLRSVRATLSALVYLALMAAVAGGLMMALGPSGGAGAPRPAASDPDRLRFGLAIALASAGLLTVSGLHWFARNLGHAYSELVIALFLLASLMAGPTRQRGRDTVIVAVFGAWTAAFELLTGPLVIGLVLTGIVAAARRADSGGTSIGRHVVGTLAVFLGAFAVVLVLQQAAAAVLTDRNVLRDFATHLALRLQLDTALGLELPPQWRIETNLRRYDSADIGAAVLGALPIVAFGSLAAGVGLSGLAAAALIAGIALARTDPLARARSVTLAVLLAVIPLWYLVFGNHTALHSLFMVRLVSVAWIGAAAILLFGVLARMRGT